MLILGAGREPHTHGETLPLLPGAAGVGTGASCCLTSPVYFPNAYCLGAILIGVVNYVLSMVTREPVSPVFDLLLLNVL